MNIVILDANTLTLDNDIDFSVFNQYGDVTIYQSSTDEEVGERIKDAEVVLCNKTVLNADKLSKAPNLKYIGLFATGYNNIDIDYTRDHSITVCNAGDYSTEAVAQHVFAFILHEYNTVDKYNTFVKNEGWVNAETFFSFFCHEKGRENYREDYWGYRLWINRKEKLPTCKVFWNEGYGI